MRLIVCLSGLPASPAISQFPSKLVAIVSRAVTISPDGLTASFNKTSPHGNQTVSFHLAISWDDSPSSYGTDKILV